MTTFPGINVAFQDGRYRVSLPWKEFHEPLQENYHLGLKWLQGLLRGLNIDPEILKEYHHLSSTTREGYRSRPSAGASL